MTHAVHPPIAPERRPRVALDCRLLHWPGVGRYCGELAAMLPAAAPDLDFFWLCAASTAASLPTADNARALVVHSRALGVAEQFELPLALLRHRIDLLHLPVSFSVPLAAPRIVVTAHDLTYRLFPELLPSPLARAYYNLMTWISVVRARRIIAVSENTRTDLLARWPQISPKTLTVLNGVSDVFARPPEPSEVERWRAALNLPKRYLLYVGTRKRHKNLPRFLEAYGSLTPAQRARFPLVMVAPPDPRYPEVDATVSRMGIEQNVSWHAGLPDAALPVIYRLAHCVVMPSLYEGFGLPVAEGYACGTPAIVARAGALPEVGGSACMLVDPYDVSSMRAALSQIIDDAILYACLKNKTRDEAARFDWKSVARRVAQVYREALA